MEKIPTAEEWLLNHKEMSKYDVASYDESGYLGVDEEALYRIMIEFAKLHVEAALKEASKKAKITERKKVIDNTGGYVRIPTIYKKHILNAYPLDKIK